MVPSSLNIGWWPPDTSMIDSRRIPMASGPSTRIPWSSGPRCTMTSHIAWSTCRGAGALGSFDRYPAIPHMGEELSSGSGCGGEAGPALPCSVEQIEAAVQLLCEVAERIVVRDEGPAQAEWMRVRGDASRQ